MDSLARHRCVVLVPLFRVCGLMLHVQETSAAGMVSSCTTLNFCCHVGRLLCCVNATCFTYEATLCACAGAKAVFRVLSMDVHGTGSRCGGLLIVCSQRCIFMIVSDLHHGVLLFNDQ